ncbi:MAG: hypothetical protein HQ582_12710 [Planctomycetes bacterium]|nr:hypothetical protein [Planctomycetota bacterium]
MRVGAVAAAVLLGFVSLVSAAPLNPEMVAEDAQWVAHLDVDAMRTSIFVENAYQEFLDKCPVAGIAVAAFETSARAVDMDPRTDLHGITAYGPKAGKEKGVLIVAADANQEVLAEKVREAADYKASKYGDRALHSWTHKDKRGERPVTGAFFDDKVTVFADSVADVKAALDVMDGKKPASTCKVLAADVPEGTTLLARAVGIAAVKLPHDSELIKKVESVSIDTGEKNGKSFSHVTVVTNCPDCAKQMGAVARGLRGLGLLHAVDCPDDKQLVANMRIKVDDKTVTVNNSAPADAVWRHVQANMPKIIEQHRKMRKLHKSMK